MDDYVIVQPNPQPTIVGHKTVYLHEDGNNQWKLLYDTLGIALPHFGLVLIAKYNHGRRRWLRYGPSFVQRDRR